MTTTAHRATEITYPSDGHDVPATLYEPIRPDAAQPGIVLCPGRIREIEGLEFLATALANNGFTVLATRYRGMELDGDDADAVAALDYLSELPQIDNDKLGIVGHSRGGVCALRVAAKDDRIRSTVSIQPPVDLEKVVRATEYLSTHRYLALLSQLGGTPDDNPQRYAALSPLSSATQIKIPVLIIAGTNDLHSPAEHCRQMYEALRAAGNQSTELVTLDGVGHFFERMYYGYVFDRIAELVVDWFCKDLQPDATALPKPQEFGAVQPS